MFFSWCKVWPVTVLLAIQGLLVVEPDLHQVLPLLLHLQNIKHVFFNIFFIFIQSGNLQEKITLAVNINVVQWIIIVVAVYLCPSCITMTKCIKWTVVGDELIAMETCCKQCVKSWPNTLSYGWSVMAQPYNIYIKVPAQVRWGACIVGETRWVSIWSHTISLRKIIQLDSSKPLHYIFYLVLLILVVTTCVSSMLSAKQQQPIYNKADLHNK